MDRLLRALGALLRDLGSVSTDEDGLALYYLLEFRRDTSASLRDQLRTDDDQAA